MIIIRLYPFFNHFSVNFNPFHLFYETVIILVSSSTFSPEGCKVVQLENPCMLADFEASKAIVAAVLGFVMRKNLPVSAFLTPCKLVIYYCLQS